MSARLIKLCAADAVTRDSPFRVTRGRSVYAVFTLDDGIFVMPDQCTHGRGSLSEGWVEGDEIECPAHPGRFNIRTGEPAAGPCTIAMRVWRGLEIDGDLYIDMNQARE